MDVQAIDQAYQQLENQSQQTVTALSMLSQKLQNAVVSGDQNAREWQLDLREIALQIQQEQNQVTSLLQSIHSFVANQIQQPAFQPQAQYQPPPPNYEQQPVGAVRSRISLVAVSDRPSCAEQASASATT